MLDFGSNVPDNPNLGRQIGDVVVATLSGEAGVQLVDRAAMARTLADHHMASAGPVRADQARKIGEVVDARLLVTGKAFAVDRRVFIAAQLIGTETGAVEPVLVNGTRDADPAELLLQLSAKVAERLKAAGPKLLADKDAFADPLPGLRDALAGRPLPTVSVGVAKRSGGPAAAARTDPAVGAEVRGVLAAAGFTVADADREPDKADKADVVVTYDGTSAVGGRAGSLVTCLADVELKAVRRKDSQEMFSDRLSAGGVDLGASNAGSAALQKGGRELGIRLLRQFADTLPAVEKGEEKGNAGEPDKANGK
jgi:TolB-like protein